MSNITVTNNTLLPIHVATSWKGIIQFYKNDLKPGESFNFDKFGLGWTDFTAVVATSENKFNHDSDASAILGLVAVGAGIAASIAGLALLPFSGGSSAALVAAGYAVAGTAGAISLAGAVIEGVEGALMPASVKALFVSDGYELNVDGGNIVGAYEDGVFHVTRIDPLEVRWRNRTSGTQGTETAPAA